MMVGIMRREKRVHLLRNGKRMVIDAQHAAIGSDVHLHIAAHHPASCIGLRKEKMVGIWAPIQMLQAQAAAFHHQIAHCLHQISGQCGAICR
jgi:hypothetical protein